MQNISIPHLYSILIKQTLQFTHEIILGMNLRGVFSQNHLEKSLLLPRQRAGIYTDNIFS